MLYLHDRLLLLQFMIKKRKQSSKIRKTPLGSFFHNLFFIYKRFDIVYEHGSNNIGLISQRLTDLVGFWRLKTELLINKSKSKIDSTPPFLYSRSKNVNYLGHI